MSLSPQVQARGLVSKALPSKSADSSSNDVAQRLSSYGEQFAYAPLIGKNPFVDEGTYFMTRTPTPGTGVSYTVNTTFSDTVPHIFLNNGASKTLYLDYLKIIVTVAPASATTAQFACKVDNAARTITTNHVTTGTVANLNLAGGGATTSVSNVYYQNNATASAISASSGSAVVTGEASVGGLPLVGDEFVFEFGKDQLAGTSGLTAAQATDQARKVTSMPPQVVPPNGAWTFFSWFAGNSITALSYSFELGWIER